MKITAWGEHAVDAGTNPLWYGVADLTNPEEQWFISLAGFASSPPIGDAMRLLLPEQSQLQELGWEDVPEAVKSVAGVAEFIAAEQREAEEIAQWKRRLRAEEEREEEERRRVEEQNHGRTERAGGSLSESCGGLRGY